MYINGEWLRPEQTFEVHNPATGEVIGRASDGGREQAVQAIDAAHSAFTCLLYTSPSPRDRTRSRMPSSA